MKFSRPDPSADKQVEITVAPDGKLVDSENIKH